MTAGSYTIILAKIFIALGLRLRDGHLGLGVGWVFTIIHKKFQVQGQTRSSLRQLERQPGERAGVEREHLLPDRRGGPDRPGALQGMDRLHGGSDV